jgi:NAD(P)H-flavin reductase
MQPHWAKIIQIQPEAPGVSTYWLKFLDPGLQQHFHFKPGQFNMLSVPGVGEAAISISSDPTQGETVGHTIRLAGNVTRTIGQLQSGGLLGVRGPFGTSWPVSEQKGKDIVVAAGGIGLPPLRPVIYQIMQHREDYGRVVLLYGARTPRDLQFAAEYDQWQAAGIEVMVTVDLADESWAGQVGVVPILFYRLRMDPHQAVVFTCGPEIMIRFVVFEAMARRVPDNRIFVSLERNMKCGLGYCGHCQVGPYFVCKDGPVFSYDMLKPYFSVENL